MNQIGNLTFSSRIDNSKMGNRDFEKKKEVLRHTSHLKMNQEIINNTSWTVDDINQRTKNIIQNFPHMYPSYKSTKNYDFDENRNVFLTMLGANAKGYFEKNNKLRIYKGSVSAKNTPIPDTNLREELIAQNIIIEENGSLIFKEDYIANSPSQAAVLILGGSRNGWTCWVNADGIEIGEVLR